MVIPTTELELKVQINWFVQMRLTHKPTGTFGIGTDQNNSRKAYARARADLENKLAGKV